MQVEVTIVDGPLPAVRPTCHQHGAGAVLCFEGVVRPLEGDRPIEALEYEVYEPMAPNTLRRLGEEVARAHGLIGVSIEHSRGRVEAGQCSFRVQVSSAHRQEALSAVADFIDRA